MSIGVEVEVGVDFEGLSVKDKLTESASYSVSTTSERQYSSTYGGETSSTESWTATSNISVPKAKAYECVASVK